MRKTKQTTNKQIKKKNTLNAQLINFSMVFQDLTSCRVQARVHPGCQCWVGGEAVAAQGQIAYP